MTRSEDLVAKLTARGVELVAVGNRLRFRPQASVTSEDLALLRRHKAELLRLVGEDTHGAAASVGLNGWPLDCIDLSQLWPCPLCGTLELWQSMTGDWHCERCDPPTPHAIAFMERAERIRKRANSVHNTTCAEGRHYVE